MGETKPHQQVANRKEHVSYLVLWRIAARVTEPCFSGSQINFSIFIVHTDLALDAGIPAQAIVSQRKSEYNNHASVDHGWYLLWQLTRFQDSYAF